MKHWYEYNGISFFTYEKNGYLTIKNKSKSSFLSPITDYFLDIWMKTTQKEKNMILNFPNSLLKPIPLISYLYADKNRKSVLIFTSGNLSSIDQPMGIHNLNYCLLYQKVGKLTSIINPICNEFPIGEFKDYNDLKTNFSIPNLKSKHKRQLDKNFKNDNPKVLLTKSNKIQNIINKLNDILDNEIYLEYEIGYIIFENLNHYILNDQQLEEFIECIEKCSQKGLKFLFHFSQPNLTFISMLKKATDSNTLLYDSDLLRNNAKLYNDSKEYFYQNEEIPENSNLDSKFNYTHNINIGLADYKLIKGDIEDWYDDIKRLYFKIKHLKINDKNTVYQARSLAYSLKRLTINPTAFKVYVAELGYSCSIGDYITFLNKFVNKQNVYSKVILTQLLDSFKNIYFELSCCKRYGDKKSYNRIAKDYAIVDIAKHKEKYFGDSRKLVLVTYYRNEVKILSKFFDSQDNVEVIFIDNLIKRKERFLNCNLLLPGVLKSKLDSLIDFPFNKLLFLSYEGKDTTNTEYYINKIKNSCLNSKEVILNYFSEIYEFIGEEEDLFMKDLKTRYIDFLNLEKENERNKPEDEDDDEKEISFNNFLNYGEYDSTYDDSELKEHGYSNDYEIYNIELFNPNYYNYKTKAVYEISKFIKLETLDFKQYSVVKASDLNEGDIVISLVDRPKFRKLFSKLYPYGENVDADLVHSWKTRTLENLKSVSKAIGFYERYKENGGTVSEITFKNWFKEDSTTIAPQKKNDILAIGLAMEDEYLIKNYERIFNEAEKIRNTNRQQGRELFPIIQWLLRNIKFNGIENLDEKQRSLFNEIEKSVYEVISID